MLYPTIKVGDRRVIILSGFERAGPSPDQSETLVIVDLPQLEAVAAANQDAVAFGFIAGTWRPAA